MAKVSEVDIIRINELNELLVRNPDLLIPVYNPATDKTVSIKASTLTGGEATDLTWKNNITYNTDDISERDNKLWKSLQDNNLNNPPSEGIYWTEVSKSEGDGTIGYWSAGVYIISPTLVIRNDSLFMLNSSITLPYESVDFDSEFAAGDWLSLSISNFIELNDVNIPTYTGQDKKKLTIDESTGKIIATPSTTSSGFYDRSAFTVTFDGVNLNLTGTVKFVAVNEKEYTKTNDSIALDLNYKLIYVYYDDNGTLQQEFNLNRIQQEQRMRQTLPVAYILYNTTSSQLTFVGDYRKGRSSNKLWVKNFYDKQVYALTGLDVFDLTKGSGSVDADARIGLTAGQLQFTDFQYTTPTRNATDTWNVGYFDANLDPVGEVSHPFLMLTDIDLGIGSTGLVVYNNNGTLTAASSGKLVWYFVLETVDITPADRTLSYMGNSVYGTQNEAENALANERATLEARLVVRQGAKVRYGVLIETKSTFSNTQKARIVDVYAVEEETGGIPTISFPSELVNGSDASLLHNHNSLYALALMSNVSNTFTSADTSTSITTFLNTIPSNLNGYKLTLNITASQIIEISANIDFSRFHSGTIHIKSTSDGTKATLRNNITSFSVFMLSLGATNCDILFSDITFSCISTSFALFIDMLTHNSSLQFKRCDFDSSASTMLYDYLCFVRTIGGSIDFSETIFNGTTADVTNILQITKANTNYKALKASFTSCSVGANVPDYLISTANTDIEDSTIIMQDSTVSAEDINGGGSVEVLRLPILDDIITISETEPTTTLWFDTNE